MEKNNVKREFPRLSRIFFNKLIMCPIKNFSFKKNMLKINFEKF